MKLILLAFVLIAAVINASEFLTNSINEPPTWTELDLPTVRESVWDLSTSEIKLNGETVVLKGFALITAFLSV